MRSIQPRFLLALCLAVAGVSLLLAPCARSATPSTGVTEEDASLVEVVVTGTLIPRKDYVAESPIVTVDKDMFLNSGTPQVEETLNFLPQFTDSTTDQSRQVNGPSPGAGRSLLNLRGLGPDRTLILLDGRRLQPSDSYNVVDVNSIPTALLDTVETITGGASAVYGSDAVGGVVNFKTKQHFSGIQVDLGGGVTSKRDGGNGTLDVLMGTNFAGGRGNAVLAASYFDQGKVLLGDRSWFGVSNITSRGPDGQVTGAFTQASLNNLFINQYGLAAAPKPGDVLSVNPNGSLYSQGSATNTLNCQPHAGLGLNPQYIYNPYLTPTQCDATTDQSAQLPLHRSSVFGRVTYDLTDSITAYGQVNYIYYDTGETIAGASITSPLFVVSPTNPTIPADLAALLAARAKPNSTFNYSVRTNKIGPMTFDQTSSTGQLLTGLKGKLGLGDWTWDVYGSAGHTSNEQSGTNYVNTQNFAKLLAAPDGGKSICAGGWNLFDTQAPLSQACSNYLSRNQTSSQQVTQQVAQAQFAGSLFNTWAGPIQAAVGTDYRRNFADARPDLQLQTVQLIGGSLGTTPVLPGSGSQSLYEAFLETNIPLLRDKPLFRDLSADLAFRRSHYDTSGSANTWKADMLWSINSSLLFRGGRQSAIRAPSVGDLFAPQFSTQGQLGAVSTGAGDPCTFNSGPRSGPNAAAVQALCIAQGVPSAVIGTFAPSGTSYSAVTTGNPSLKPEQAESSTVGVVFQPKFLPPLFSHASLSVDYYRIQINNAINSLSGGDQVASCFNTNGQNPSYSDNNVSCQAIQRDSTGQISNIYAIAENLFHYKTSGIDTELDWRFTAEDIGLSSAFGALDLNAIVTKVNVYEIQTSVSQAPLNFNGLISGNSQSAISSNPDDADSLSHPAYKAFYSATWSKGSFDFGFRVREIGAMKDISYATNPNTTIPGVGKEVYIDLNAHYKVNEWLDLRGGEINVTDRLPQETNGQPGLTDPNLYDRIGRRFFVMATAKFQ